jgi:hypothetical protein
MTTMPRRQGSLLKIFFLDSQHISKENTQIMHVASIKHDGIAKFSLKPYTLAGFELGTAVPEAAAMSTAPL